MLNTKNKTAVILKYLLLILFVWYYSSISFFYHKHLVNGEVIVHSHPFNNPGDSHTSSQYHLIKLLSSFAASVALSVLLLTMLFSGNQQNPVVKPYSLSRLGYVQVWFRRGPPSAFFV